MRKWVISAAMLLLAALLLTLPVRAAEFRMTTVDDLQLPSELVQAAPEAASVMDMDAAGDFGLFSGAEQLWREAKKDVRSYLTAGVRSVSALLAGVLLLGVADSAMGSRGRRTILMAGTLFITAVSAGDLQSLIGLGQETISRMTDLTTLLLPVLSAACAASGSMTAAALRQTATVWFSGMLLQVIEGVFLPMVYLYVGTAAADAVLERQVLDGVGVLVKKGICWGLTGLLGLFVTYLTVSGAIGGTADAVAVKAAKTAISVAVPVVGGVLAKAADTLLAGAGLLRGMVGVFGMLAILSLSLAPVLRLGAQYVLYQTAASLAEAAAPGKLAGLMRKMGTAFMLVLAMTASSAAVLLIAIVCSCKVVAT